MDQGELQIARESVSQLADLQKESPTKLLEIGRWLLDREQWEFFDQLIIKSFPDDVAENPQFIYCSAEAALKQGDQQLSVKLAEQAFALMADASGVITDPTERIWLRFRSAISLEERGLTDWAIREYQRVASMETPDWRMPAFKEQASRFLAELLHDRQRDQEAADALANLMQGKRTFRLSQNSYNNDWPGIVSRMHFFRAEQYRREANRQQQISHLRQGLEADPTDSDVLIAMHRLPRPTDAWVRLTQQSISQAARIFEERRATPGGACVKIRAPNRHSADLVEGLSLRYKGSSLSRAIIPITQSKSARPGHRRSSTWKTNNQRSWMPLAMPDFPSATFRWTRSTWTRRTPAPTASKTSLLSRPVSHDSAR